MLVLTKFLYSWLLPPGILVAVLFLLWLYLKFKRAAGRKVVLVVGLALYALSLPSVSELLVRGLESRYPQPSAPAGDVLVFLGGGAVAGVPDVEGWDQLSSFSASRLLTVARLQKRLGLPVILSGGKVLPGDAEEAVVGQRVLVGLGVPAREIFVDARSRNTAENARYTKELCVQHGWTQPLLVTSALHLPRATAFFKRAGLNVTPYPCDYQVGNRRRFSLLSLAPRGECLADSSAALKEYLGLLAVKTGLQ